MDLFFLRYRILGIRYCYFCLFHPPVNASVAVKMDPLKSHSKKIDISEDNINSLHQCL